MKDHPTLDAKLSDICISTSAAPTMFPAYCFTNEDNQGNTWEFNLIDGGLVACNPVYIFFFEKNLEIVSHLYIISLLDYSSILLTILISYLIKFGQFGPLTNQSTYSG